MEQGGANITKDAIFAVLKQYYDRTDNAGTVLVFEKRGTSWPIINWHVLIGKPDGTRFVAVAGKDAGGYIQHMGVDDILNWYKED